ncbi:MAG: SH3 domain-containing protein [Oscillospiraceae bacterium]|nr:SH3 domain-containing protein [Oscillospiraceae bacterium]
MGKGIKALLICFALSVCMSGCAAKGEAEESRQTGNSESAAAEAPAESKVTEEIVEAQISAAFIDAGDQQYVSLFQQPDSSSVVIARLYTGDEVSLYGLEGEWSRISVEGLRGYVLNQSIVFKKPEAQQTTAAPETTVRTEQSTAAAAQTQAPANITIVLKYDSQGIALPSSYPEYESYSDTRNGYCSAHACNMYKTASRNGPKREVEMLYEGDAVTIHGEYNDMYYLGTDSGSGFDYLGYVPKEYIKIGTPPPSERKNYNAVAGIVDATSCHLRSTPTKETSDNIVATVYKGFEFEVISFDGFWYYIRYDGGTAYISHKMVKVW